MIVYSFPELASFEYREFFELRKQYYSETADIRRSFVLFTLFVIIISTISNIFTLRVINNIVRPLKPLEEGVRQIQNDNLAYRINYQKTDEFRPICEAFDEMTSKLEASVAERQRDDANRRELIAGLSHDLRTPLTSIKGYIEGLETGVASTPAMQEKYIATIKSKAADMEHIIEQLFLFSKVDIDDLPLTMRRVTIAPVIRDMIEEITEEYAKRGLDIHLAEIPPEITVTADTLYLRNVIINILENSVTYKTKSQGRIEINADVQENNMVTLRFVDDGPGVADDALVKLFDAHYRTDPSRNKKGSGLGLAISAKIIERMGGTCNAELPSSGGLAIVISLPTTKEALGTSGSLPIESSRGV
jgi:signal transduction histidine kinase